MNLNPLERDIEKAVCDYAKLPEHGPMLVYKFTSPSRRSVPDRMFITITGKVFFCEFKRKGEQLTPAQAREHQRLKEQNVIVYVIDSIVDGKMLVELMS